MATRVKLDFVNLDEFLADLERLTPKMERGMEVALYREAELDMARSNAIVPTESGRLAGSGFVGVVGRWDRGLEVKFGYGEPYALYQHYGHYEHDDGQRLFLEAPVRWSRRGLASRIRAIIARALR